MFACRDATDRMTDEREGSLSGALRFKYRLHLLICPYCRTCRRQLDEVIAVAGSTRREAPDAEPDVRALAALRERARKR